jgi:hypothetical protein
VRIVFIPRIPYLKGIEMPAKPVYSSLLYLIPGVKEADLLASDWLNWWVHALFNFSAMPLSHGKKVPGLEGLESDEDRD